MTEPLVRQMKLTTGDEIICEVVEWDDDEGPAVVIRNALKLITIDREDGIRYHVFRPFMIMQLEEDTFQSLNSEHILVEATPVEEVVKEYYNAINKEQGGDEDDAAAEEKYQKYMQKIAALIQGKEFNDDSDVAGSTIIRFPGNDKMH